MRPTDGAGSPTSSPTLASPPTWAHPLATKAISSARVKNGSVDAKTLAHLLRTNLLPEAWIAPPEVRVLAITKSAEI